MKVNRRKFLKTTIAFSAAGIALLESTLAKAEWLAADFAPGPFDATMKQLLKGKPIVETDKIAIVVEQNPVPLVIQAQLMPELEPFMSARLKIANTSFVFALVETEKVCYSVKKKVKVTIGGCGG